MLSQKKRYSRKKRKKFFDGFAKVFLYLQSQFLNAKVAQLVEHNLAKVGVAGSNPVFRSKLLPGEKFFSINAL